MNDTEDKPVRKPREITISRRLFIAGTLVGGTAIGVGAFALAPGAAESFAMTLRDRPLAESVPKEAKRNDRSIIRTAIETLVVFAANVGLGSLIDRLGIDHGGHAADGELYEEQLEKRPLSVYVRDNFAMPLFEESIFRLLPSAMLGGAPGVVHWKAGLATTAVFAGIHNFSKPAHDKITIHLDSLPVEQFVLGMYCWYAQRKGGFVHAAGSHVLYNNLCEAYWHLYEKKKFEEMLAKQDSNSKSD